MLGIHAISIAAEVFIVLIGLAILLFKKKAIGLGIALTYGIYVFYDIAKYTHSNISQCFLYGLFFIATLSMLLVVIRLYKTS
ncbi:MAG: hypothetical protein P9X27_03060 [Candidatus Kaelpia aquatica]|nr:hypothetical protein [Candidatus Kaelpia aquatica]